MGDFYDEQHENLSGKREKEQTSAGQLEGESVFWFSRGRDNVVDEASRFNTEFYHQLFNIALDSKLTGLVNEFAKYISVPRPTEAVVDSALSLNRVEAGPNHILQQSESVQINTSIAAQTQKNPAKDPMLSAPSSMGTAAIYLRAVALTDSHTQQQFFPSLPSILRNQQQRIQPVVVHTRPPLSPEELMPAGSSKSESFAIAPNLAFPNTTHPVEQKGTEPKNTRPFSSH